jgi:hypothetical protein
LKSHLIADLGDWQRCRDQQLLGALDTLVAQISMRRLSERRAKGANEMKRGETGEDGEPLDGQRPGVMAIDEVARLRQGGSSWLTRRACHAPPLTNTRSTNQ